MTESGGSHRRACRTTLVGPRRRPSPGAPTAGQHPAIDWGQTITVHPPSAGLTKIPPSLSSIQCLGAFSRFRCFLGPRTMVVGAPWRSYRALDQTLKGQHLARWCPMCGEPPPTQGRNMGALSTTPHEPRFDRSGNSHRVVLPNRQPLRWWICRVAVSLTTLNKHIQSLALVPAADSSRGLPLDRLL